jgi:hypothetical protein
MWDRLLERDRVDCQIPTCKTGHGKQDQSQAEHGIKCRDNPRYAPYGVLPDIGDREGLIEIQATYQVPA